MIHLNRGEDKPHEWLTDKELKKKFSKLHAHMNRPQPFKEQGAKLKEIRIQKRKTLRKMSERLGLKASQLSDIERGIVEADFQILEKLYKGA